MRYLVLLQVLVRTSHDGLRLGPLQQLPVGGRHARAHLASARRRLLLLLVLEYDNTTLHICMRELIEEISPCHYNNAINITSW